METELIKSFTFEKIHENELRKFSCWGSVEVKDRHNEIIPASEVYKVMDIWMDRGAPIMFNHTNRQIGKGLNWQPLEKNGNAGVLITATIFKHYQEDDQVWEDIKKGKFEGLSIGGKSYDRETKEDGTYLKSLIGYEFSIVERCGNQEATFDTINMLAKNEKVVKEIKKEDEVVVDDTNPVNSEDEFKTEVMSSINKISERLDMIEETISGGASNEEPVEEQKEVEEEPVEEKKSEEEPEEEEKSEEEDEMKKELVEIKKSLEDLKKSQVKEVIKTQRPAQPKAEAYDLQKTLDAKVDEMVKTGKFNFSEVGAEIRKAQELELAKKFNQ